jgi:uncharacterized protein
MWRDRWLLLALALLLALPVEPAQATSRAAESAETEEAPANPAPPAVRRPAPKPAAPRPAPAAVARPRQPAAPQPVVNVPPCFPRLLLPPSGRDAKPEILGTMDPLARANYMQAIHLLHCETGREAEGLALLKDGAKLGFRPSIRALGSRIIDDPAVLGDEAGFYLKIFTKEANAGSASAANLVGVMMDGGIGTKADPVGAGKFYRAAAADGSQRALEWLAYTSATGRGTRADRAAAQRFHARLERDRGVRAARDIVVALELGREGKRDEAGARIWAEALRNLDKDGDAKVAVELEKAWENGTDTKADLDILAIAKRYNGIEARYQIALRQLAGAGEAQRAAALADLRSAALAGHAGAAQTLAAMMVASGADGTIATQVSDTLRMAVNTGNPGAMLAFANQIYFADTAMPKLWLAAQYMRRAAEAGLPEAQHRLGLLLMDGLGVDQDRTLAISWLTKARDAGYPLSKQVLDHLGLADGP